MKISTSSQNTLEPPDQQKTVLSYSSEGMVGRMNSMNWAKWILHSFAYGVQFGNREVERVCVCVCVPGGGVGGGGGLGADK